MVGREGVEKHELWGGEGGEGGRRRGGEGEGGGRREVPAFARLSTTCVHFSSSSFSFLQHLPWVPRVHVQALLLQKLGHP